MSQLHWCFLTLVITRRLLMVLPSDRKGSAGICMGDGEISHIFEWQDFRLSDGPQTTGSDLQTLFEILSADRKMGHKTSIVSFNVKY